MFWESAFHGSQPPPTPPHKDQNDSVTSEGHPCGSPLVLGVGPATENPLPQALNTVPSFEMSLCGEPRMAKCTWRPDWKSPHFQKSQLYRTLANQTCSQCSPLSSIKSAILPNIFECRWNRSDIFMYKQLCSLCLALVLSLTVHGSTTYNKQNPAQPPGRHLEDGWIMENKPVFIHVGLQPQKLPRGDLKPPSFHRGQGETEETGRPSSEQVQV